MGVVLVALTDHNLFAQTGILSDSFIDTYMASDIDSSQFFLYILKLRVPVIVILWLLGYTMFGEVGLTAYVVWLGFRGGILLTACIFKLGLKGMLYFIAAGFPQIFIYLIAVGITLIFSQKCYLSYFRSDTENYRFRRMDTRQIAKAVIRLFIAIFIMILGCLVESYVNPLIFKNVLKIF